MNRKSLRNPYIIVISCENRDAEQRAEEYLKKTVQKAIVKSKTAQKGHIELNYEIMLSDNDTSFISDISEMEGITSAVLVSYNGDYLG